MIAILENPKFNDEWKTVLIYLIGLSKEIKFAPSTFMLERPNKYFLIVDSYHKLGFYYSISQTWKRYLSLHSPKTKLIVAGFSNYKNSNYIDLLNFPDDFNAFIKNTLPVSDDWEIPIDGENLLDTMLRFFEGHGRESVLSALSSLKQTINMVFTDLSLGYSFTDIWHQLISSQAKPELEILLHRWLQYYPYFEYLPFYPLIQEINDDFSDLSEIIACNKPDEHLFLNYPLEEKLCRIYYQLVEIDKLYIRPELYIESQSAPDR